MKNISILSRDLRKKEFLKDIKKVCENHGLTISHDDGHGSFRLEDYSDNNIYWLEEAIVDFKENSEREENFMRDKNFEKLTELLDVFDSRCGLIIEDDIITKNRYGEKDVWINEVDIYEYNCPLTKVVNKNNIEYYINVEETYEWFKLLLDNELKKNKNITNIRVINEKYAEV